MTLSRVFFLLAVSLLCLGGLLSVPASAQIPLSNAVSAQGYTPLSISYIEDNSGANSVIQANIEFNRMRAAKRMTTHPVIKLGGQAGTYWIELALTNNTSNEDWWFSLEPAEANLASSVKSLVLYDPQDPQLKPVSQWPGTFSALPYGGVPLKIKSGQTKYHYVMINTWSGIDTNLVPTLRTQDNMQQLSVNTAKKQGLSWLVVGAVFGIGIVQLLLTRQLIQGILALNALFVGLSLFLMQRGDLFTFASNWHPVIMPLAITFILGIGASLMLLSANIRYKMDSIICLLPLVLNVVLFGAAIFNLDMTIAQLGSVEYLPRYLQTAIGLVLIAITLVQGFATVYMYWFLPAWLVFLAMPWLSGDMPYALPVFYLVMLCVAGIAAIFWQWKSRDKESESLQKRLRFELKNLKDKFHLENENWRKKMDTQREMLNELRTREQQRSAELEIARRAADEANEAKSDFLAIISHEIRTPMNGIMGIVQILTQTELDEKQIEYVDVIKNSGDTMLTLLNDILDYSKIEKGAIELEEILFSLRKMVNSIAMLMSGRAKDKGISIEVEIDDNIPDNFYADPQRIRQVLLNLVGNAIKFTDRGSVTIRVSPAIKNTTKTHNKITNLRFEVVDTGIGISPEAQDKLFQAYVQADSSISRRYGGTGLGLNICKMLIGAMKGEISVTSIEGEGSTFWFEIPLRVSEMAPADDSKKSGKRADGKEARTFTRTLDILVIDDNDINLKIVSTFLEMDGHHVVTAGSGAHALSLVDQERFDLIFVDILMPNMNGQTFLRKLREKPDAYYANIPVFALTGMADKKSIDEILAMGLLGVLIKPITQEALRNAIQKAFHHIREDDDIELDDIMAKLDSLSDEEKQALRNALLGEQKAAAQQVDAPLQSAAPPVTYEAVMSPALDVTLLTSEQTQEAVPETEAAIVTAPPAPTHGAELNMAILGELKTGLPADTLKEIFDDLIVKAKELTGEIEEAATQSDFTDLGEIAHNLKGMAGNFGLQALMDHSGAIEKAVRDNENEKAAALVMDSRRVLEQSLSALDRWLAS